MKLTISVAALAAAMAGPVLAQDAAGTSTMTCADFMAMDEAGMTAALGAMRSDMGAMGAAGDAASTDAAAATETASADTGAAEASGEAASTDMASADASGGMGMDDPVVQAMQESCTADPSMMASDAFTQASGM